MIIVCHILEYSYIIHFYTTIIKSTKSQGALIPLEPCQVRPCNILLFPNFDSDRFTRPSSVHFKTILYLVVSDTCRVVMNPYRVPNKHCTV